MKTKPRIRGARGQIRTFHIATDAALRHTDATHPAPMRIHNRCAPSSHQGCEYATVCALRMQGSALIAAGLAPRKYTQPRKTGPRTGVGAPPTNLTAQIHAANYLQPRPPCGGRKNGDDPTIPMGKPIGYEREAPHPRGRGDKFHAPMQPLRHTDATIPHRCEHTTIASLASRTDANTQPCGAGGYRIIFNIPSSKRR